MKIADLNLGNPFEALADSTHETKPWPTPTETVSIRDYSPILEEGVSSKTRKVLPRQDDSYQSFVLGSFPQPTSSGTAPAATASTSVCPDKNGTEFTSLGGIKYQITCGIDFDANNFPFQLVGSFEACVEKCDAYNYDHHKVVCLASLYVPSRAADVDDCYLKSSVAKPVLSNLAIQGAVRLGRTGVSSTQLGLSVTAASLETSISSTGRPLDGLSSSANSPAKSVSSGSLMPTVTASRYNSSFISGSGRPATTSVVSSTASSSSSAFILPSASAVSNVGVTYAAGNQVIVPRISRSHLQGPTVNTPSKQYISNKSPPISTLANSLLTVGVNGDLTTGYDISLQTGVLEVNISTQSQLLPLSGPPHLSRDGGRGGFVNGQHLFVFCDTGSYTTTTATTSGKFLGFVSSSVAIDIGMNGLTGQPLNLQDGIGQWSDDTGRQRGFSPLTQGEQSYNQALQGNGQRYAVWPESSIIPLDATTGLLYAPIVYDNVNRATKVAVFTYTGTTLLTITAGGRGGPVAHRTVHRIFDQDEIEWGCAGGIRSWGRAGIGGDDGLVYIFGNIAGGILAGRTSPASVGDRDSVSRLCIQLGSYMLMLGKFEYWDGTNFTSTMPTSSSKAFFIEGAFMDVDVFYSPRHLTFIIVYLTIYADSTFYYRYLEADQGILPPFAPGGDTSSDYVENIFKYKWSDEQVLYKAAQGLSGKYIYAGGVHAGYYGSNDITNGGTKMLLSWTAPTGLDPSSFLSEYQIVTAEIDWA